MGERADKNTLQLVEALLFLENGPINIKYMSKITGKSTDIINDALHQFEERLKSTESALTINKNENGDYQLIIIPVLYEQLGPFYDSRKKLSLSPQALETLAIIAYKQPITRAEIEKIRGVNVGYILRVLLEYEMIRICGKKNVPGRPILYGSTSKFLKYFGLLSLKDLPSISEFERT
jgi:segregation and condensation protein B